MNKTHEGIFDEQNVIYAVLKEHRSIIHSLEVGLTASNKLVTELEAKVKLIREELDWVGGVTGGLLINSPHSAEILKAVDEVLKKEKNG